MKSEQQRLDEYLAQNNSIDDFNYVKGIIPIWLNDIKYNFDNYTQTGLKPITDSDLLLFKAMLEEGLNKINLEKEDRGL